MPAPIWERQRDWDTVKFILMDHGIDPTEVLQDGIGESGYYVIVFDHFGHRVIDADYRIAREFHEWPVGFPVQQFLALLWGIPVDLT
jgi:hypothetical protein